MGRYHRSQICVISGFVRFILHGGTCLHSGHSVFYLFWVWKTYLSFWSLRAIHNLRRRRIQKTCDGWLKWKKKWKKSGRKDMISTSDPIEYKLTITAITGYILPSYITYMAPKCRSCFESGLYCRNLILLMSLFSVISLGTTTHPESVKDKVQKDKKCYFMC